MIKRWLVIVILAALVLPNVPSTFAAPAPDSGVQALFIENVGQFHPDVRYVAYLESGPLFVTEAGLWLSVLASPADTGIEALLLDRSGSPPKPAAGAWIRVSFKDANPLARLEPAQPGDTPYSYFLGSAPENWHSAVPAWSQLRLIDLYPGLTLELSAVQGQLRLQAQTDDPVALAALQIRVEGAETTSVDSDRVEPARTLLLETPAGSLHFPLVEAVSLPAAPPAVTAGETEFVVASPYTTLAAAPEPSETGNKKWYQYSTYLGGRTYERALDIAANRWGAAYVMGWTFSPDFPITPGAFDPSLNGAYDMFVVRLDPLGERLLYATFLGGAGEDYGIGLVIDAEGSAYITGYTTSNNYPLTPGAFDTTKLGYYDGFVTRLHPSGGALVFSTYLGGSEGEHANALALDAQGRVYVVGMTTSPDFPLTADALDTSGEYYEAFLSVFEPDGSALIFSTLLGGQVWDEAFGVYAAGLDRVYVGGMTDSKDFPHTPYAFDRKMRYHEGFVACYDLTQPKLVYATLLGGRSFEAVTAVAADKYGYAYATGYTTSQSFPTTLGAYDREMGGDADAFITKLAPDGRSAEYSTFLGGSTTEVPTDMVVDKGGAVYLSLWTNSSDFPVTEGAFDTTLGGVQDAVVLKFARDGSRLVYSTFLGGSGVEFPGGLSLSANGSVFITGITHSPDFPVTPGVVGPRFNGYSGDGFVTRLWVQDHPPKDPALMTAEELYLEEKPEEQAEEEAEIPSFRLYLPVLMP